MVCLDASREDLLREASRGTVVLPQIERVKGKESAGPAENSFPYSLLPLLQELKPPTIYSCLHDDAQLATVGTLCSLSKATSPLSGIFSHHKKSNRAGSQCSLKSDSASANTKEDQGCLPL